MTPIPTSLQQSGWAAAETSGWIAVRTTIVPGGGNFRRCSAELTPDGASHFEKYNPGFIDLYRFKVAVFGTVEVTGIAPNGVQATVAFNYSWRMTPAGDTLVEPLGQRSGTAFLRLYDDGWRAESATLSDPDRMAASAPNTFGMADIRFRRIARTMAPEIQQQPVRDSPVPQPRIDVEADRLAEMRKILPKGPPSEDRWTGQLVDSRGSYVVEVRTKSSDQTFWMGTATVSLESNPSRELAKTTISLTLFPEREVKGFMSYDYKVGKKACDAYVSLHGKLTVDGLLSVTTKNSSTCERKDQIGTLDLRREGGTISPTK